MTSGQTHRVLVIGINGMLGSMVYQYFNLNPLFKVFGTYHKKLSFKKNGDAVFRFDAKEKVDEQLIRLIKHCQPEYIINCIGIIKPWCKDNDPEGVKNAIIVNALFPHLMAETCHSIDREIRIINIATDCVYDGSKGNYLENAPHNAIDVYGKTKSLGEVQSPNLLNIRTSIIGPEWTGKKSLLEWFLSNTDGTIIKGFTHHFWNGVTTLQFAQLSECIITEAKFSYLRNITHVIHYVINEAVNKFELLKIFNEVYNRKIIINPTDDYGEPIDRTLNSMFLNEKQSEMKKAIVELKEFQDKYYNK